MIEALVGLVIAAVVFFLTPQGVALIIGWRATRRRRDERGR